MVSSSSSKLYSSAKAVGIYRRMGGKGMVGLVSDCYSIDYMKDEEEYREAARFADLFFNISVNDVCVKGEYPKAYMDKLTEEGYDLS